ncbi:MAG TPA: autotransporter outer membrane beta-barrel domain-containing protein [Chlamydiales bacterium]|nr:autotransporter outer membrane beta-barrel domain-containing protein [Chlamydiales bacterium]
MYRKFLCFGILAVSTLSAQVLPPPYASANRRHVADNLNTLDASGLLNAGLQSIVTTLSGFNSQELNHALDQFHPAIYSALVEVQAAVGGQLLSLFSRGPMIGRGNGKDWRFWVDPIGNWLREGNLGQQVGFEAITKGTALGMDGAIGENWTVGFGFSWNHSALTFHQGKGRGKVDRYLGAVYADFLMECFYLGLSVYGGIDRNDIDRLIQFPSFDSTVHGKFNSLEWAGQFATAYLIGFPYCYFYPYASVDFLYLQGIKSSRTGIDFLHFQGNNIFETGSSALNLNIRTQKNGTIRSEAGIGLQMQDSNHGETISIVPTFAFGWAMECPIFRPAYKSGFLEEPLPFKAKGWNHVWQLLVIDFGLAIYIYDFVLSGEYVSEMSTNSLSAYWGQWANISLEYFW